MAEQETINALRREEQAQAQQRLYALLAEMNIPYEKNEHPPVYTTEEAERLCTDLPGLKMKNLLVKDKKSGRFFLVLLEDHRRLDFKGLKEVTGWRSPTFATEEELWQNLRLTPGSVTALALINQEARAVTVVLDRRIGLEAPSVAINFHPCINTATIALSLGDFHRFLERCGNPVVMEKIDG